MKTELAIKRQITALEKRRARRPSMGQKETACIAGAISALRWALEQSPVNPLLVAQGAQLEDMGAVRLDPPKGVRT